ncbi:MAG: tRNA (N6-threonylcarbamoyladenosine(37)-N6)-methyltransferase TrmO [Proteobacteria bacterium]|nr:tRNA (N6-threonylcarbamoyladenosine(37)-N6)-methyltransferase TrmO [Cystobacterineae bacterium]MCL2258655.1 tRNA (N6-threonylcarbamoyladenosine(37)-N6)-methyltransferase TrmO [Cystobacterineae bacterium]MCL2314723.1 tRNA (N6-threonylcarbamoyladenosine(37)-N6)-methyltransferase TrmO [Pseudomonadota bacterium]
MTETFSVLPIGYVRSAFKTRQEIPLTGGPAILELKAEFADALDGLESNSHLLVMGFLHQADRKVLKSRPMKVDPTAPTRGVFSTRSPARPNPISLTVVPLLGSKGLCLEVERLDLLDGTPLVDIKPYSPGWDGVFCARHKHRAQPTAIADAHLVACMERDLENFMGPIALKPKTRWVLAMAFVATRFLKADLRDSDIQVSVNRMDETTEALMALTGAAFFNHRLLAYPETQPLQVQFKYGAQNIRLRACISELPHSPSQWPQAFTLEEIFE